jgi:hypothetical protein
MIPTRLLERIGAGLLAPAVAALLLAGCEVENPGAILDENLNDELILDALVTGISSDFSEAYDDIAFDMARGSDELSGSGSYFETNLLRRGILNREDQNFEWGSQHRTRWVAEDAVVRMDSVLGADYAGDGRVARAWLFAAFAHRMLGETVCFAVIDSSAAMDHEVHFDSALVRADSAIHHAQLAGDTASDNVVLAAYGIKAAAYAALENWTAASTEAARVPTDFVYLAYFSSNSGREENEIWNETSGRPEMSAYGTLSELVAPDPRAPWVDCDVPSSSRPSGCPGRVGADGDTPHYLQIKYPDLGSDMPFVKGTEMRLIEAEALLEGGAGNIGAAVAKMDEARAEAGLTGVSPVPTTINDAWILLDQERHLTLWMEARRWHDARRWDEAGRRFMPAVAYIYGDPIPVYNGAPYEPIFEKDAAIEKRATCIPISLAECQTNPKLIGSAECQGSFVQP